MKSAAKKMAEKTEWEKAYDRIKANAQKVDIIAEREAFEAWQAQCGLPIEPRYHDDETGYNDNLTGRHTTAGMRGWRGQYRTRNNSHARESGQAASVRRHGNNRRSIGRGFMGSLVAHLPRADDADLPP